MLLARAAELRAALTKHLALKDAGQQGEVYRTRLSQLRPLAEGLSRAQQDCRALKGAGVPVRDPEPKPGLRTHAQDILERFQTDRAVLARADESFRHEFTPALRNAIEEVDSNLRQAWDAYVAERGGFPSEDVLGTLAAVPAYAPEVERIREALRVFERLSANPPAAADAVNVLASLNAAVRKKDDALAAMRGDDLPEAVMTFLRKTGQGSATLADLTEPVRKWLDGRGLEKAFRIVPARV